MGVLDTSYTFQNTDTITSTKMNNIIDQSTFTSGAIFGDTLELVSGQLKVRALGITSAELGTNSVTTAAIANSNVTSAKLATNIAIAGTFSVAGTSTFTGVPTVANGLTIGTVSLPVPTGTAPLYAARAWGRYSGGTSPALVNGRNIGGVTRTTTGKYVVSLATFNIPSDAAVLVTSSAINYVTAISSTSLSISFVDSASTPVNPTLFSVVIFA